LNCGSDTTRAPEKDQLTGKTLVGKYLIQSSIGSGAMGTIYKAEQTALGKTVVIKVLHKHLLADPELIQRFHREARAASRLNHPNCVQIMDFGTLEDGALYIAMEYIHGIDLATLLEREYPLDHRRLLAIMKQVMMALDEAHANGVLHRDLKPENIMIEDRRTAKDHVKVVDFGIAKLDENNPNSTRSFQTRTGIVCGTPEYMSPEQARGQKLDARCDLYAIGVMLYHMVTDRLPFEAASPIEVVTKHISEPPVPPRMYRADLPEALERLILTLLEKDRENRPASAMDVHAEIERIDRELALERREQIREKTSDDATMVDMRPISQLIDAIDALPAVAAAKGKVAPTPVVKAKSPAKVTPEAKVIRQEDLSTDQTPRDTLSGKAGASSLHDTIPEPQGRQLAERLAAAQRDAKAKEASRRQSEADTAKATRAKEATRKTPVAGTKAAERKRPDAPLHRDDITVDVHAAQVDLESEDVQPPRKRQWLWVVAALVIAGGVAAVVLAVA
jgi:serine/threonine protein kinase